MTTPYQGLEVIETYRRSDGYRAFVRDAEDSFFWLVEYMYRRLVCWCPDGEAHAESPDTEPECEHARAVVDHRTAASKAAGPPLGTLRPAVFTE